MSDAPCNLMNVRFTIQEDIMQITRQEALELEGIDREHDWQRSRFTETVTCASCALLPLDQDDVDSPCTGP